MAGHLNRVQLLGNLGRDPEVRSFQNGGRVANLSIATTASWKDRTTGEKKENTQWHRVAIFVDGLVDIAEKYLKKGSKVYVEGQLETRKWTDQQGVEKYSTEVVLRPFNSKIILLDGRNRAEGSDDDQSGDDPDRGEATGGSRPAHAGAAAYQKNHAGRAGGPLDDDIPF